MDVTANLDRIHDAASRNREALLSSARCGCFSCESVFHTWDIEEWTDNGDTAVCPKCRVTSVLPEALPEGELSQALLHAMCRRWFGGETRAA
jgi:NAD-dependent SIR2 family protein deacetylase